jgi:hypothetical protein
MLVCKVKLSLMRNQAQSHEEVGECRYNFINFIYLFICFLFDDAFSVTKTIQRRMKFDIERWIGKDLEESRWPDFMVISRHSPGGTEKNH